MADAGVAEPAAVPNGADHKLSAAAKKKLRRKKTRDNNRELKAELQKVHKHVQQLREAEQRQAVGGAEPAVSIEYVPAPLKFLAELKASQAGAQADADPLAGMAVDGLFIKPEDQEGSNPLAHLERLAQRFGTADAVYEDEHAVADGPAGVEEGGEGPTKEKPTAEGSDSGSDDDEDEVSRKKRKADLRMTIAALKANCARPEVVEVWDVSAPDPNLLVYLKAYRNTVPVPRHWSQKRKFLQGKRGIEKPPFELPNFIKTTGALSGWTAQRSRASADAAVYLRHRLATCETSVFVAAHPARAMARLRPWRQGMYSSWPLMKPLKTKQSGIVWGLGESSC